MILKLIDQQYNQWQLLWVFLWLSLRGPILLCIVKLAGEGLNLRKDKSNIREIHFPPAKKDKKQILKLHLFSWSQRKYSVEKLPAKEELDEMFNAAAIENSHWRIIVTEINPLTVFPVLQSVSWSHLAILYSSLHKIEE